MQLIIEVWRLSIFYTTGWITSARQCEWKFGRASGKQSWASGILYKPYKRLPSSGENQKFFSFPACTIPTTDTPYITWENKIWDVFCHDDVIKWKHFPRNWPLCGEFTGPGEFPSQRPVTRSLMFTLICVWINGCVNNLEAGDLRRYCTHYGVTVMVNTNFDLGNAWVTAVLYSIITYIYVITAPDCISILIQYALHFIPTIIGWVNTIRPEQNSCHITDNILKCISYIYDNTKALGF